MTIRKTLFWMHLAAGLACGLVVAMMATTGFLLAYERQIKDWADRSALQFNGASIERANIDYLLATALTERPDFKVRTITLSADPEIPPFLSRSYLDRTYIHPASGAIIGPGNLDLQQAFARLLRIHRWFDLQGAGRTLGELITGAANLLFLFLLVSGIYMWFPRVWGPATAKQRLLIQRRTGSRHERYFNWHHVFGFWSFFPLLIIITSGAVFSYDWVQRTIRDIAGDDVQEKVAPLVPRPPGDTGFLPLDNHLKDVQKRHPHWRRLVMTLPEPDASVIKILVDTGTGGQPQHKNTIVLDRTSGDFIRSESITNRPRGARLIEYLRWLHTGEIAGVAGQTVAALVSALVIVMIWSGWALAWRRLVRRKV